MGQVFVSLTQCQKVSSKISDLKLLQYFCKQVVDRGGQINVCSCQE